MTLPHIGHQAWVHLLSVTNQITRNLIKLTGWTGSVCWSRQWATEGPRARSRSWGRTGQDRDRSRPGSWNHGSGSSSGSPTLLKAGGGTDGLVGVYNHVGDVSRGMDGWWECYYSFGKLEDYLIITPNDARKQIHTHTYKHQPILTGEGSSGTTARSTLVRHLVLQWIRPHGQLGGWVVDGRIPSKPVCTQHLCRGK